MSFLNGFFNPKRPGGDAARQEDNALPPPPIMPLPAGRGGLSAFADLSAGTQSAAGKYGPAIVIGLGKAGEVVLRQWIEKLAQDPAGPQSGLRVILISDNPISSPLPNHIIRARVVELGPVNTPAGLDLRKPTQVTPRVEMYNRFKQVSNYKPFRDWLGETLLDLHGNVQVFIIGSLAEPVIGTIGGLLQILRAYPESQGRVSPYANVIALLSLAAADNRTIPQAEIFAVQREIGRFTFAGPHCSDSTFGTDTTVQSALLDHLFLVENYCSALQNGFTGLPFEFGMGQSLAELLLALTHPSGRPLWQFLADELRMKAGQVRESSHEAVAHSFGIATLDIPVTEVQAYISARLAHAAIYGERPGVPEGLINQRAPGLEAGADTAVLVRRWLLNGPYHHRLFEWLLNASAPAHFTNLPVYLTETDFVALFRAQISVGLVGFLNDPAVSDLAQAGRALEVFKDHLDQVEKWFMAARGQNQSSRERFAFQADLNGWRETLLYFITALKAWQKALFHQNQAEAPSPAEQAPASLSDWRSQFQPAGGTPLARPEKPAESVNVHDFLQAARRSAENALQARALGRVCRPVTADSSKDESGPVNGIAEVELYYADTIRPELSRFIRENNPNFTRVRERLEWWINLTPGRQPDLLLLCWPVTYSGIPVGEPPSDACFTPADVSKLGQALLAVCHSQVMGRTDDLTGPWFRSRVAKMANFLYRANDAYLRYNREVLTDEPNAASRRSFLIAQDQAFSQEYLGDIFQDTPRLETHAFGDGEKTRFTALSFRMNIPAAYVSSFDPLQKAYDRTEVLHLYPQETTARNYEKRLRTIYQDPDEPVKNPTHLPPELTLILADPQRVSIFFQALLSGLISFVNDEAQQKRYWSVAPIGERFPALALAPADEKGLWNSFRLFALELPNDPRVNLNPSNHFHPARRDEYMKSLNAAIRTRSQQHETIIQREQFKNTTLAELRTQGHKDLLARSLACLIAIEMDEPVWKDW